MKPFLYYLASCLLTLAAAGLVRAAYPSGPPVDPGVTTGIVKHVGVTSKIVDACISGYTSAGTVELAVADIADGDDLQRFAFTIEGAVHEDGVACLRDRIYTTAFNVEPSAP